MSLNLKSLVGKLNETTRKALESAAGLCVTRTHYDVEVEHYLMKLLDDSGSDLARICERFGVDTSRLSSELTRSLDRLRSGNARTPSFSPSLISMFTEAWMLASIDFSAAQIRSGFTILALVSQSELSRLVGDISREFRKIDASVLQSDFNSIISGSTEQILTENAAAAAAGGAPQAGMKAGGKTPNLDQFTIDLTQRAKQGRIDPVLGRDSEIRQIVDILMRRRQNNPILTGEAGVGKTAVVEGFALRVANGDVPPPLQNVVVRSLDLALLQAGAGVKGEFENRLKGLIEEVKSSPVPIILFIDEAHTVSTLKGSPPGYVGYGEGGVLTEAVRRRPYSVVLLDEVEKAHPDVLELFYQVFDKGMMEDGEGREIDFKNTILILTSNAGTETLMKLTADPETMPLPEGLVKAMKPELDKIFKPAFLGRMVIVPFYPVRDEVLKQIIVLKLDRIRRRIAENHKLELSWDAAVLDEIAKRCTEIESGARNIDSILTNTVLPDISRQMLGRMAEGLPSTAIKITVAPEGGFAYA